MKRRKIVPLVDVADYSDTVTCLDLDLPDIEPETLGVDIDRLHRVMHWGGIGRLAIGSYEGDTTQYTASAVKLNPDGTLSGSGMKIAAKAKLAEHESQKLGPTTHGSLDDYEWRNTAVYLNTPALEESPASSSEERVQQIDKVLRSSLRREIASNEVSPKRMVKEVATTLGTVGLVEVLHMTDADLLRTTLSVTMLKVFYPPITFVSSRMFDREDLQKARQLTGNDKIGPKYSTMFYWRFDRTAMAAKNLARQIITPLPDEV